jgi:hypothetical protein
VRKVLARVDVVIAGRQHGSVAMIAGQQIADPDGDVGTAGDGE